MAKTKIAVGNLGAEELAQFKWTVRNRSDTQMEADALFGKNPEVRKKDRAILEKLFIQTPASTTNAPNLQKTAGVSLEKLRAVRQTSFHPKHSMYAMHRERAKELGRTASKSIAKARKAGGDPMKVVLEKSKARADMFEAGLAKRDALTELKEVTSSVKCICPKPNCPACKKQKTSAIDAYMAQHGKAKLSSAQVRYPELLKVAAPAPILPKKINTDAKTGPTPAQSSLAGGSA